MSAQKLGPATNSSQSSNSTPQLFTTQSIILAAIPFVFLSIQKTNAKPSGKYFKLALHDHEPYINFIGRKRTASKSIWSTKLSR